MLRTMIEKLAQLTGIDLDDGLTDRLIEDTNSGDALPLLAFNLAQLADGISRSGRLSNARYEQLGEVPGTLTRQADTALADVITAGGHTREQVIAGLLRLVTVTSKATPPEGGDAGTNCLPQGLPSWTSSWHGGCPVTGDGLNPDDGHASPRTALPRNLLFLSH